MIVESARYRIGFDLNQPVRIDESADLHNGIGGANFAEIFTVDFGDGFPIFDSREKSAGTDNMIKAGSCIHESLPNNFETDACLSGRVAAMRRLSIFNWGGAGD